MFVMDGVREFVFSWSIMMGFMMVFNWDSGSDSQDGERKNDLNRKKFVVRYT